MIEQGESLITVDVRSIERAEYVEGHKAASRKDSLMSPVYFSVFLFLLFFLAYWLLQRDQVAFGIAMAGFLLFYGSFKWVYFRQLREARARGNKMLPVRLTFKEHGVLGETRDSEAFRTWPHYVGYVETNKVFVLLPLYRYYSVIPKRVIDPTILAKLQELLSAKMKRL